MKKIVSLYLFTFLVLLCDAQELKVKSFVYDVRDLSARTYPKTDINGDKCALLKVGLALANVEFEGNVIDVVKKTGEYWVYMADKSKKLKVKHNSYLPIVVTFSDYGINEIEKENTYSLNILSDVLKPFSKSFKYTYKGVVFKCKAKQGCVTITGFDTKAKDIVIPSKVYYKEESYPVTTIDIAIYEGDYRLNNVVIEDGVLVIAKHAFFQYRRLTNVTIPNSIVEIGKKAFRNNSKLSFVLPDGISEEAIKKGEPIVINR